MPRGGPDWGFLAPQKNFMQLCREQNHFFFRAGIAGQGAGRFSEIQLWNPADSGVDAFVNMMGFECESTQDLVVYWYAQMRDHLKGYGTNRYAGGTESTISARWEDRGIASWSNEIYRILAGATRVEVDHLHLWLTPGWGLDVLCPTADLDLEISYTWYEFLTADV